MKNSPVFPKAEDGRCNEADYDPKTFFSQFLEEARMYASDAAFSQTHFSSSERGEDREGRKNKKSWKSAVSSLWFKFQKTKKMGAKKEAAKLESKGGSSRIPAKQRIVSGPLFGNGGKLASLHQKIRTSSGPLSGCFTPTRAEELEVPYMYLNQHIHHVGAKTFGPIYLVT